MHLLVSITQHGFGHAAQVAPVIDALIAQVPALQVSVWSRLPESFLRQRIQAPFRLFQHASDFGLMMNSALNIDLPSSAHYYAQFHADWNRRVAKEARRLEALAPDLVLADVPYLTLAAAQLVGIENVALCSLNWADIYRHYFSDRPESTIVLTQMEAAYQGARAFLCPEPSMPMSYLGNRVKIGPIAARGRQRRQQLNEQLDLTEQQMLVLVATGGVQNRFPIETWPVDQGIHWLVDASWQVQHPNVSALQDTGIDIVDHIASCDAVLGKCGYGTVSECVVNRTTLLYVPRLDWPEEKYLLQWLEAHRAALPVPPQRLVDGLFREQVVEARQMPVEGCEAGGAEQAAGLLKSFLQ